MWAWVRIPLLTDWFFSVTSFWSWISHWISWDGNIFKKGLILTGSPVALPELFSFVCPSVSAFFLSTGVCCYGSMDAKILLLNFPLLFSCPATSAPCGFSSSIDTALTTKRYLFITWTSRWQCLEEAGTWGRLHTLKPHSSLFQPTKIFSLLLFWNLYAGLTLNGWLKMHAR